MDNNYNQDTESALTRALALHKSNNYEAARSIYNDILTSNPHNYNAWHLLGVLEFSLNNLAIAEEYTHKAIKLYNQSAVFYNTLGSICFNKQDFDQALKNFTLALKLDPQYADAAFNTAKTYIKFNNLVMAKKIIIPFLNTNLGIIWRTYGIIQELSGHIMEAEQAYIKSLQLEPNNALALNNLAKLLINQNAFDRAEEILGKLLKLPINAATYNNLGYLYLKNQKIEQAIDNFKKALYYDPHGIAIALNLGICYHTLYLYEEAIQVFDNIIDNPNFNDSLITNTLFINTAKLYRNLSFKYTANMEVKKLLPQSEIHNIIKNNNFIKNFITPFDGLVLNLPKHLQHQLLINYQGPNNKPAVKLHEINVTTQEKINVGYISANFGDTTCGFILENFFTYHDKNKFNILALSLKNFSDSYAQNIKSSVDRFISCDDLSDNELIYLIQSLKLDILVDLNGYTQNSRPLIFNHKLAKTTTHWLGYTSSVGTLVDYHITDIFNNNHASREHFIEKLIILPQVIAAHHKTYNCKLTRADYALPEDKFIFSCLSKFYCFNQKLIKTWAKILREAPNSALWLNYASDTIKHNILSAFSDYKIKPNRIIFNRPERLSDNWSLSLSNLWLDTIDFSSGTAVLIALYCQLPILTIMDARPQTKTAASYLHAANLNQYITTDVKQYIELACNLANNNTAYKAAKNAFMNTHNTDLFQIKEFMQYLEKAYQIMLENFHQGIYKDIIIEKK